MDCWAGRVDDWSASPSQVAVDLQDVSTDSATSASPFIIVGGGPAGTRAAQELARRTDRTVHLFSDEHWGPYNRVKLTPLLAREVTLGQVRQSLDLETAAKVNRLDGCRIVAISPAERVVRDHTGRVWPYEKLILATGSRPHRPPIPGIELSGVYTFRSLNDAQALVARVQRTRHTVVVGGGLLGLEAARGMLGRGVKVSVIEHETRPMARQLDQAGGDLLRSEIEALGIIVRTSVAVRQIVGTLRVEGIFLSTGEEIACDTIIICTGVRPNRELALEAGLDVGQGIKVDDRMQTSNPHIFAIGECAEHDGIVDGLVAPGLEQARTVAAVVTGNDAFFRRGPPTTRLKVVGTPVFSSGEVDQLDQRTDIQTITYANEGQRQYRRVAVRNGRVAGALAVGEWSEVGQVQQLIERGQRVWPWQIRRFRKSGLLLAEPMPQRVAAWPAAATVCNCTGVTRGQLTNAITHGCQTVEALATITSASAVCGTCRPLLAELLGDQSAPEPVTHWRILGLLSALALCGILLIGVRQSIPIATSFSSGFAISKLFIDGTLKQISGFVLVGLSALAVLLSLRKRWPRLAFGDFATWRLVHAAVGAMALVTLVAHTGFRLGTNLNLALIASFLAASLAGTAAGAVTALEHKLAGIPAVRSRRINPRVLAFWFHLLACWPLPYLLAVHIAAVYFY